MRLVLLNGKAMEAELIKAEAEKTQALNELETALRQEMNEQQAERELAFKNYEERTNAYMEREGRLNDQIRDLQTQVNDQRAQIDAFIQKDQQEKPPVKTKTQKDKGGDGPMEPGTLKHLLEDDTPLKMKFSTDQD